jgi:hypothetical protein
MPASLSRLRACVLRALSASLLAAPLLLSSCKSSTDATHDELVERLDAHVAIHLGCPSPCGADRTCGQAALDRLSGGDVVKGPVIIEAIPYGLLEASVSYYFVEESGAGTMYYERRTDTAHCDDCGWHKETFARLVVAEDAVVNNFSGAMGATGRVTLTTDNGRVRKYSVSPSDCE